jgi:hypothetical protein
MTAQYDPKGTGGLVYDQPGYATFAQPTTTPTRTVSVNGRAVALSTWIYAWAAGGLIVGPIIGLVILFLMCQGVHR